MKLKNSFSLLQLKPEEMSLMAPSSANLTSGCLEEPSGCMSVQWEGHIRHVSNSYPISYYSPR